MVKRVLQPLLVYGFVFFLGSRAGMFDYGVCFGGMLRGYASPKSNIPALHKLDTLKKDKPILVYA